MPKYRTRSVPQQIDQEFVLHDLFCICGKRGWRLKSDAMKVVFSAKIARSLWNNANRREQRVYECGEEPGIWHVTSMTSYDLPVPTYDADDDMAARKYIVEVMFHRDAKQWDALLSDKYAKQTLRVLRAMYTDMERDIHHYKNKLNVQKYSVWLKNRRLVFSILQRRIATARLATKRLHVKEQVEHAHIRRIVRSLAQAIVEHENVHEEHWHLLNELYMPGSEISLREMVETSWSDDGVDDAEEVTSRATAVHES